MNNVLLIHIPKTAGTSVKHILLDNNINYKELHFNRKLECMPVDYLNTIILNPNQKVIIPWRNPIEHVLSTFHFYKEYTHFRYPTDLNEFIDREDLHNQQTSFLFKKHFLTPVPLEDKLDILYKLINRPNTFMFLQDSFDESLTKLNKFLGVQLENKLTVKRFNYNKMPFTTLSDDLRTKIEKLNKIDMDVYNKIVKDTNVNIKGMNDITLTYIPWRYPLNLIAGIDSITKYEDLLKSINYEMKELKSDEYKLSIYINNFIDMFCKELGLVLISKEYSDKLLELGNKLNDKSEKITILTRF